MPANAGIHHFPSTKKKAALVEKSAQKLLRTPAFERPQYGRSKAGVRKSFLLLFFKKEVLAFLS